MLHALALAACVPLCAVGFRIRGGWAVLPAGIPGQVIRLIFAICAALTAYIAGASAFLALLLVPAWWVGCLPGWGSSIDLGRHEGSEATDFLVITGRGLLWVLLPAALIWWSPEVLILGGVHVWGAYAHPYWWALLIAGLACPLCYWTARQCGVLWPGAGARDFVPMGEAIWGAMLGLGSIIACFHASL